MTSKISILPAAFATALLFTACSSTKNDSEADAGKKKTDPTIGQSYAQRSGKANWSDKHRSSFEKQAEKAEKTKSVKTGFFHTNEYTATKSAGGMNKKYHSKDFSQGDKKNNSFEKSYNGSRENHMGSEKYKTSESHLAEQKNHDEGRMSHDTSKSFSGSSESYQTHGDAIGSHATQNAQKSKGVQTGKPSYSEDEVRALLNKG